MSDDTSLLSAYVREGSEPAFRQLVERHIPLVHATARRILAGDDHLAQDVTQKVFTDLALKAAGLPQEVVLGGWLHRHTCFTASKTVRAEQRRRTRERAAMELNAINDNTGADARWTQIAPVLDDALNSLPEDDRDVVVLRYFEQRDLQAIGGMLGVSDDTAQKRVSRALEKLRAILTRRGVTISSVMLASTLEANTVPKVPSTVTASISATALSGAMPSGAGLGMLFFTMSTFKKLLVATVVAALVVSTVLIVATSPQTGAVARPGATPPPPAPTASKVAPVNSAATAAPKVAGMPSPEPLAPSVAPPAAAKIEPPAAPPAQAAPTEGLHYVSVPFDATAAVRNYISKSAYAKVIVKSADPDTLETLPPLALYNIDMSVINAGGRLESAHEMGGKYQVIVESNGAYVANALMMDATGVREISGTNVSSNAAIINLTNGSTGQAAAGTSIDGAATARALDQLAKLDPVRMGSYEVRVIFIPYISMARTSTLLWLKSETSAPDLLYFPAGQVTADPLQTETLYTADDFFKLAMPIIQVKQEAMRKRMPPAQN